MKACDICKLCSHRQHVTRKSSTKGCLRQAPVGSSNWGQLQPSMKETCIEAQKGLPLPGHQGALAKLSHKGDPRHSHPCRSQCTASADLTTCQPCKNEHGSCISSQPSHPSMPICFACMSEGYFWFNEQCLHCTLLRSDLPLLQQACSPSNLQSDAALHKQASEHDASQVKGTCSRGDVTHLCRR